MLFQNCFLTYYLTPIMRGWQRKCHCPPEIEMMEMEIADGCRLGAQTRLIPQPLVPLPSPE